MDWKNLLTSFQGRINRQPYWLGAIVLAVISVVLIGGAMALFATYTATDDPTKYDMHMSPIGWIITVIAYIALIWFGLAIQVKRWHDRDKSGWWVLIGLVPVIGGIWALVECGFLRGTPGANRFGPDPLA